MSCVLCVNQVCDMPGWTANSILTSNYKDRTQIKKVTVSLSIGTRASGKPGIGFPISLLLVG